MHIRITLATVSILTAGLFVAPIAGAVVGGSFHGVEPCTPTTQDDLADVIAPPSAFVLGWKSSCSSLINGGTITWKNLDAIPHFVRAPDCFVLDRMSLQGETSVTLHYDAANDELRASTSEEPCMTYEVTARGVELAYDCGIHGPLMPGTLVIEI